MTSYHFEVEDAVKYGISEAIIIQNFRYWINQNKANNRNFYDGNFWTYNSITALTKLFPFFSKRQIENTLNSLVNQGVLLKGNYNENQYDRTCWYAFKDEKNFLFSKEIKNDPEKGKCISPNGEMDFPEKRNRFPETVTPIPNNKPYRKPNEKERSTSSFSLEISEFLLKKIRSIHPKFTNPNLEGWATEIDLMIQQNQHTEEEIKTIITWIYEIPDPFWRQNIVSTKKLRQQYDSIFLQMMSYKPTKEQLKCESENLEKQKTLQKMKLIKTNREIANEIANKYCPLQTGNKLKTEKGQIIEFKCWQDSLIICEETKVKMGESDKTIKGIESFRYSENGFKDQIESYLHKIGVLFST